MISCSNGPSMGLNDGAADGQADAHIALCVHRLCRRRLQLSLKNGFETVWIDAHAVVSHLKYGAAVLYAQAKLNLRRRFPVDDCIFQKVQQHLFNAADGGIQLLQVVPEGKKPMDGTSFAAGLRLKTGDVL